MRATLRPNWLPCEAFYKAEAPEGRRLRIRGVVSTEHRDAEEDVVLQAGLDFAPCLARGVFNDEHSAKLGTELGVPERVFQVRLPDGVLATAVEGYLTDDEDGRRVFKKAQSLSKLGRPYGFSLEGAILMRDSAKPWVVTRARVDQIAITRRPANQATALEALVKSASLSAERSVVGEAVPGDLRPIRPEGPDAGFWRAYLKSWDAEEAERVARGEPRRRLSRAEAAAEVRRRLPEASPDVVRRVLKRALKSAG